MTRSIALLGLLLLLVSQCGAYSSLTHEAIIDSVWDSHLRPLLMERFPNASPDELKTARAYVYGGCQIQDMGYFPFASRLFSDLTHYARSGDFVAALVHNAENLNEFAFALGALAHYASDLKGHPAVNRATGQVYPKLRAKFGDVVTYEDAPAEHLKTEFSFDVVQVARQLYAPDAYHDFIGFEVSKPVLERSFQDTYGIEMKEIFGSLDLGIGTYRFTIGKLVPEMTKVAWDSKRADIVKLAPGTTKSKFKYALPRRRYEKEWGKQYRKPGFFARFVAFVFRLIPTFGPFKVLAFKPVPAQAEQDFLRSFEATVEQYRSLLTDVRLNRLHPPNYNLDTGKPTQPGEYKLADESYVQLVDKLAGHQFGNLPPALRTDILAFFTHARRVPVPEKTLRQVEELKPE